MHQHRARRAALRGNRVALAVAAAFLPWGHAYGLPTGENVVHGDVTVTRPTAETMQINQGTQKGIVNWQGFSIGASEHVNITQPGASASLLNRVVGNNPSEIFGRLTANGQVFLVNNAGVLFAPSASVEVGSLVASTLSITDQNFLNNNYQFFNPGNAGSVVNQGSIVTANGYTALIGPQVRNDGVILAQSGKVALGAGERVTLDMVGDGLISISVDEAAFNASVVNTGTIQADGGTVILKAQSANALLDSVINTSGVIRANALVERNGEIVLDGGGAGVVAVSGTLQAPSIKVAGDKVGLLDGARVDASGDAGGGTVFTHARALYVGADAAVSADALQSGDGGRIILWSSDSTQIHGTVSARRAGEGSGGFVETSGGYLEITRAPEVGAGGTWLIDPFNISVVAGVGTVNNTGAPSFTPNGNDSQVGATLISNQLNTGANVVLDTGGPGSPGAQAGNLAVNAAIVKTAPNAASLTLNAANDITVNADVFLASGNVTMSANRNVAVNNASVTSGGAMTVQAGGALNLNANALDARLTSNGGQTVTAQSVTLRGENNRRAIIQNNIVGDQSVTATVGSVNLQVPGPASGVAQIINNAAGGNQTVMAAGQLTVQGGAASGSTNSGIFKNAAGGLQKVKAAAITLMGAANGLNAGALISSAGDQLIDATGGNINLTGGDGGERNNAIISASPTGQQTVLARDINMSNGSAGALTGGTDTVAAILGGHQLIDVTGSVTLSSRRALLGTAPGGPGVRIGAPGGSTTGTNLTLLVDGNLTVNGGTAVENGAAIGSSGQGTPQQNTITIDVGGNVTLQGGGPQNTGVRIGSGSSGTAGGNISVKAGGAIAFNPLVTQRSAAIRTLDRVTLEAASITLGANGSINGGVSTNANMLLSANAFNLAAGAVEGGSSAVILRPRDGARAFRIGSAGSAGETTISNADIAKINTSNFVVFGSGTGTIFTGDMTIGQNEQVNGGAKSLAFFRSSDPAARSGTITIGAHGVTSAADVIVLAGKGGIVNSIAGGGTIAGDEVQLRASQGIGTNAPGGRIQTAANALAINDTGPAGVFVTEVDNVTLRTISLNVGGIQNIFANSSGGIFDLTTGGALDVAGVVTSGPMTINAGGALNVTGSGFQDALLISGGGQTITAQSINLAAQNGRRANIENLTNGNQSITATAGDINLQVAGGFGVAQIVNTAPGADQTISVNGQLNVLGGVISPTPTGSRNSGLFKQAPGGLQTVSAAGITLQGASSGTMAGALINSQGDQFVDVTGGTINLIGGSGGITNNALIAASPTGQQTVLAHDINMRNGVGGTDTVAGIFGGHQLIDATGNVTLISQAALVGTAPGGPGVRIGAPGGSGVGTDLTLYVDGNLVVNGGTAVENGAAIGSTGVVNATNPPRPNTIHIEAGSVTLNGGTEPNTGVRIGSGSSGTAGGNISIEAVGTIALNGTQHSAAIRTLDTVTLVADRITETGNGFVIAGTLNTTTNGDASLTGPNQVSNFSASSAAGDVVFNNSAPLLTVTSITAQGISISQAGALDVVGNVTSTGAQTISATGDISIGADRNAVEMRAGGPITMSSGGNIAVAGGTADGSHALVFSSADINLTVGGFLTIDGSPGAEGWARIQTATRDSTISVFFPNLSSGGYFVNGVEGRLRDGHTGFLSGNGVAAPGHQFITTYGVP